MYDGYVSELAIGERRGSNVIRSSHANPNEGYAQSGIDPNNPHIVYVGTPLISWTICPHGRHHLATCQFLSAAAALDLKAIKRPLRQSFCQSAAHSGFGGQTVSCQHQFDFFGIGLGIAHEVCRLRTPSYPLSPVIGVSLWPNSQGWLFSKPIIDLEATRQCFSGKQKQTSRTPPH